MYKTIILSNNEDTHSVIILTGKVRMLSMLLSTEFINQKTSPRIPKIIYVSL